MKEQTGRVVMLGDSFVGKTSIVKRMCENEWSPDARPTVSTAYFNLKGPGPNGDQEVQIWDTAGAERYRALNSVYYHNAMGGIIVFDLTNRSSFDRVDTWYADFSDLAEPGAVIVLVGNKLDLWTGAEEQVNTEEGEKWAHNHQLRYFSTSAEDGTGIPELVKYILTTVPQRLIMFEPSSVDIGHGKISESKSNDCC
jgi:small GTP-binding protein